MSNRFYVVEAEIAGRRDAKFRAGEDEAPWRFLPRPYAGMAAVADRIAEKGFPVLFPLQRKLEIDRYTCKPIVIDRPAYVGYMLASFDARSDDEWGAIRDIRGVRGVLRLGEQRPIPVRRTVVEKLLADDIARSALTLDAMLQQQRRKPRFAPGDIVAITDGPFRSIQGPIEVRHDSGGDNIRLTVAGWLDVTVPSASVEAA